MDKNLLCKAGENLRLLNIILYEGSLKRFNALPDKGELGQQNKLGAKLEKIRFESDGQSVDILRIFVDLGVRVVLASSETENEPEPLYQIEALYQVDYEIKNAIEQSVIDEFAKYNAVHHVWPFWRQYVFSMANQANLPCPEVPLNTSLQSLESMSVERV